MQYLILLSLAACALSAPQQVPYVHQEIPAEPYVHAVLDPSLPGCLCPVSSSAGALCAPGDPCRALCPCRDPCRALLWRICWICWTTYWICWTSLDWRLCKQSWTGGSLQAVKTGRGRLCRV